MFEYSSVDVWVAHYATVLSWKLGPNPKNLHTEGQKFTIYTRAHSHKTDGRMQMGSSRKKKTKTHKIYQKIEIFLYLKFFRY